ncbi:MAG: beta-lactamase family protein, partial [Deltaproteobacteria bacterium]|nr:beta-lactamase family protein [Deltaproteobacteria bacterium]
LPGTVADVDAGAGHGSGLTVQGTWDRRFAPVADAFQANLTERGETGAALSVWVDGTRVADLWGGVADPASGRQWAPDTLVNVFSVGKAFAAVVVWRQVEGGLLDPDRPVAAVWPAFAAAGKEDVTLRQVLAHQAGLPAVRRRLPPGAMFDRAVMADALAAQEPWWEPGTAHGYHVNTFGVLCGEVLRRATGASAGTLLRDEVVGPLGADVHLGLPEPLDARVAPLGWAEAGTPLGEPAGAEGLDLMRRNAYLNPAGLSGFGVVDTRAWRAAELPGTNVHASARGVAAVYDALLDGRLLGETILAEATAPHAATGTSPGRCWPTTTTGGWRRPEPAGRRPGPATPARSPSTTGLLGRASRPAQPSRHRRSAPTSRGGRSSGTPPRRR